MKIGLVKLTAAIAAVTAFIATAFVLVLIVTYPLDALGIKSDGALANLVMLFFVFAVVIVAGAVGKTASRYVKRRLGTPTP